MSSGLVILIGHFASACTKHTFLGLIPWYQYLPLEDTGNGVCEIHNFTLLGSNSSLLLVLLAIVDDLLRLAGLFAVIFMIYSGVKYIMSQGSPDEVGKAQTSIKNALIGLALALVTIPLVSYLATRFGGGGGGKTNFGLDLGSLPNPFGIEGGQIVGTLLSVTFNIVGALSLLFIVIGGYNYVMSNGEANKAGKAKNTILYALIGLVVTITAQSVVSFVVSRL